MTLKELREKFERDAETLRAQIRKRVLEAEDPGTTGWFGPKRSREEMAEHLATHCYISHRFVTAEAFEMLKHSSVLVDDVEEIQLIKENWTLDPNPDVQAHYDAASGRTICVVSAIF